MSTARSIAPPATHPVIAGFHGSVTARNALAYAVGMAKRTGRPLVLVYVIPVLLPSEFYDSLPSLAEYASSLGQWLLTEAAAITDLGELDLRVRTVYGNPARELAALATKLSAEALVVGAPVGNRYLRGPSVPTRLARYPSCPVIVVP
jgi:nucleotide-binding universal stress UspA family protein